MGKRSKLQPSKCRFEASYEKGMTRMVCKTHDWQIKWMPNLDAITARNIHEREREGK